MGIYNVLSFIFIIKEKENKESGNFVKWDSFKLGRVIDIINKVDGSIEWVYNNVEINFEELRSMRVGMES